MRLFYFIVSFLLSVAGCLLERCVTGIYGSMPWEVTVLSLWSLWHGIMGIGTGDSGCTNEQNDATPFRMNG